MDFKVGDLVRAEGWREAKICQIKGNGTIYLDFGSAQVPFHAEELQIVSRPASIGGEE